jgi:predicted ribosome quality control (RQC) complex YloA/Tae2 family protein
VWFASELAEPGLSAPPRVDDAGGAPYIPHVSTSERREPSPPAGILQYALPDDWQVIAGRTDAANDYVSVRLARPRDRWFHVRGMPGAHVLLRVPPEREPDRATLERAAGLAAYHSKARTGGTVPVSMTEGRHVSKPRGAKPGTVEIRKETVLKVRPPSDAEVAAMRRGDA